MPSDAAIVRNAIVQDANSPISLDASIWLGGFETKPATKEIIDKDEQMKRKHQEMQKLKFHRNATHSNRTHK